MRAITTMLVLAAGVVTGCAYDPYTGTYVPCCSSYGYPYGGYGYRYPSPYSPPYGYPQAPYGAAPSYQQPSYQQQPYGAPPAYQGQPYGAPPTYPNQPYGIPGAELPPAPRGGLEQQFAAANVTGDGRLTPEQAIAGMPVVAENFYAIDAGNKGYVTLPEVRAFLAQRHAQGDQVGESNVP